MGYQSRRRNYKSRRERYLQDKRHARIIFTFACLALVVAIYKNREDIWFYLKTYFY